MLEVHGCGLHLSSIDFHWVKNNQSFLKLFMVILERFFHFPSFPIIIIDVVSLLQIIQNRLATFDAEKKESNGYRKDGRRLALLDSLLTQMHAEQLTLDDIQEEVDTFMFEGHDTTAAALNFFCYLMGCYPDIQAKVHAEMDSIFGGEIVIYS